LICLRNNLTDWTQFLIIEARVCARNREKMKRLLLYIVMPLVSFVLLTSCISENMDDCERCKLTFSYLGDVDYDIFPQHITYVSLYVFDANNRVVQTKRIEQNELKAYQGTKLNLVPGAYRIIGEGNT